MGLKSGMEQRKSFLEDPFLLLALMGKSENYQVEYQVLYIYHSVHKSIYVICTVNIQENINFHLKISVKLCLTTDNDT